MTKLAKAENIGENMDGLCLNSASLKLREGPAHAVAVEQREAEVGGGHQRLQRVGAAQLHAAQGGDAGLREEGRILLVAF